MQTQMHKLQTTDPGDPGNRPGQGFWYFTRLRSREIQVNPRNLTKFKKHKKYREIQ